MGNFKRINITLPDYIHEFGTKKAEIMGKSFSQYVSDLIAADNKQAVNDFIDQELRKAGVKKGPNLS